jgi:hypothetical protein
MRPYFMREPNTGPGADLAHRDSSEEPSFTDGGATRLVRFVAGFAEFVQVFEESRADVRGDPEDVAVVDVGDASRGARRARRLYGRLTCARRLAHRHRLRRYSGHAGGHRQWFERRRH